MASDRTSAASLLERLEIERSTFDDTAHPLAKYQQDGFHLCCDLLRENIVPKPTKHGYARLRARTLLLDVFAGIGAEVFVLCTLAMPITDLSKVPHKHTVPKLREWWKKALHPPGLTTTATELCAVYAIETLATPARKRPPQEYSSGLQVWLRLVIECSSCNARLLVKQAFSNRIRSARKLVHSARRTSANCQWRRRFAWSFCRRTGSANQP